MSVPDKSIDPRLLSCAEKEFMEYGFIKAELKRICKNADITTGAVYKRYKGKEDLFSAVVEEIEQKLNDFLEKRSNIDFSLISDDEIYDSWIMTYDSMIPLFKLLYEYKNKFKLLIDRAAGTRYENFSHDFVIKMSYAYEQFYDETFKRSLAHAEITREEFHVLLSSFWTCICEPFIHDMTWKQIEEHCRIICRFFDWKNVIMLKREV
ncbi:MAG: TetR/AcrR family transcriptional regulator [Lachnospiraceae bacterium]|nr:TetR/AcrR family transcriptional regulator [Lachnospiraceae bacterium]